MPKYLKFILIFLLSLIFFLLQRVFVDSWSGFWGRINIPLLLVISIFIFNSFKSSFYFALFLGIILDLFSFYPFGLYSASLLLTLLLADFVWSNFFTNRSIYSFLVLGVFLTIFYNVFSYFIFFLFENNLSNLAWFNRFFWLNLLYELVWVFIIITALFYLLGRQKGRFSGLSFEKN